MMQDTEGDMPAKHKMQMEQPHFHSAQRKTLSSAKTIYIHFNKIWLHRQKSYKYPFWLAENLFIHLSACQRELWQASKWSEPIKPCPIKPWQWKYVQQYVSAVNSGKKENGVIMYHKMILWKHDNKTMMQMMRRHSLLGLFDHLQLSLYQSFRLRLSAHTRSSTCSRSSACSRSFVRSRLSANTCPITFPLAWFQLSLRAAVKSQSTFNQNAHFPAVPDHRAFFTPFVRRPFGPAESLNASLARQMACHRWLAR